MEGRRAAPGWDGARDAAEFGLSAPQPWMPGGMPPVGSHGAPPFGEDCLTLNLWTPGIDDARRPVLVWIHGGGFLTGSGSLPFYACDTFARDGDLVAISINDRLGPLVIGWAGTRYGDRAAALYDSYAEATGAASPRDVLTQMVTDGLFRCGGLQVAAARAVSRPAHVYQFEVASPLLGGALGATHCMELPFTFANIDRWGPAPFIQGIPAEIVERVTGPLHDAWISFICDGDPNARRADFWQPYRADDPAVLVIGNDDIRV